jgi:hypothetical protein
VNIIRSFHGQNHRPVLLEEHVSLRLIHLRSEAKYYFKFAKYPVCTT